MSEFGQIVINEVRRIAAASPDRLYEKPAQTGPLHGCLYMHGNTPGCIMGHALVNLGILPAPQVPIEGKGVGLVLRELGFNMDGQEEYWLNAVQVAQDGRSAATWGEAVRFADSTVMANA